MSAIFGATCGLLSECRVRGQVRGLTVLVEFPDPPRQNVVGAMNRDTPARDTGVLKCRALHRRR